jgi:hypothetical protein
VDWGVAVNSSRIADTQFTKHFELPPPRHQCMPTVSFKHSDAVNVTKPDVHVQQGCACVAKGGQDISCRMWKHTHLMFVPIPLRSSSLQLLPSKKATQSRPCCEGAHCPSNATPGFPSWTLGVCRAICAAQGYEHLPAPILLPQKLLLCATRGRGRLAVFWLICKLPPLLLPADWGLNLYCREW